MTPATQGAFPKNGPNNAPNNQAPPTTTAGAPAGGAQAPQAAPVGPPQGQPDPSQNSMGGGMDNFGMVSFQTRLDCICEFLLTLGNRHSWTWKTHSRLGMFSMTLTLIRSFTMATPTRSRSISTAPSRLAPTERSPYVQRVPTQSLLLMALLALLVYCVSGSVGCLCVGSLIFGIIDHGVHEVISRS